jgi:hypothetical protein
MQAEGAVSIAGLGSARKLCTIPSRTFCAGLPFAPQLSPRRHGLDTVQELERPSGEQRGGIRVVRRERSVGEVVLVAGVGSSTGGFRSHHRRSSRLPYSLPYPVQYSNFLISGGLKVLQIIESERL